MRGLHAWLACVAGRQAGRQVPCAHPSGASPSLQVVFCCLARRVNLEVAQTLYNMGIPFAWVHNNQVTCSWLCGLRGSSTSTSIEQMEDKLRMGIEKILETQARAHVTSATRARGLTSAARGLTSAARARGLRTWPHESDPRDCRAASAPTESASGARSRSATRRCL